MIGRKKAPKIFGRTAARGVIVVLCLLAAGSCDNPMVQEILRSSTVLDNLTVHTEENIRYTISPDFDSNVLYYETWVPYSTTTLVISGIDHRDADIRYSISPDGEDWEPEQSGGVFNFIEDFFLKEAWIRIRVNRPYMDERIYTLHVNRIADSMIWSMRLKSRIGVSYDEGMYNPLSPGYMPELHSYKVRVNAQAEKLQLWIVRKPGVVTNYRYRDSDDTDFGPWTAVPAEDLSTGEVAFGQDNAWMLFEIQVVLPDPEYPVDTSSPLSATNPVDPVIPLDTYRVEVQRPYKVEKGAEMKARGEDDGSLPAADGRWPKFRFELNGGPRFVAGNPVSFTLIPPFGNNTTEVTYNYYTDPADTGSLRSESLPPVASGLYTFIMPEADVTVTAQYEPVPAASDVNVRYVWEGGSPFVSSAAADSRRPGDARTWDSATEDLQALMDLRNADGAPGTDDDYEIWIAAGTITPDWTTAPGGSWASAIAFPVDSVMWSFVLTEGVEVYGGFDGTEENAADRDNRDWRTNKTVLSGSLGERGTVLHALVAAGTGAAPLTARMEGLTVHGGYNARGYGTSITINGQTINGNYGGVMYAVNARPLFRHVDFEYGCMPSASGIALQENAKPVLINCSESRSQSSVSGSGLSLLDGTSRLVMRGGGLRLNWDAGGVFSMTGGKALLVNTVIENNNENPVNITGGTGIFINTTIAGNRGTTGSDAVDTISTGATNGAVELYNSVVRNNFLQTYGARVWFYDTIAPNIHGLSVTRNGTISLPDGSLAEGGNIDHYPLAADGTWNDDSPGYGIIVETAGNPESVTPGTWEAELLDEIKKALMHDGEGGGRFKGSRIDLGAVRQ
jgi:hypothetical protein